MAALEEALSERAGHNTDPDLGCDDKADEQKSYDFMEALAKDKNRPKYNWKPRNAHHCRTVARDAYEAGRQNKGWW